MAPPIRVLIADDHVLVRRGLRSLLDRNGEFQVVAEADNGYDAIELATRHRPDVVLLDVAMPRLSGTDAAAGICEKVPTAKVVIISMHSDEAYVLRALTAGARGYLLKASSEADILTAIRAVAAGNAYFSPSITKMLVEDYVAEVRQRGLKDSYDLLTIREKEILQCLTTGKTNRETAELLQVSVSTIETHRNNILQKLQLHSLADLILYAVRKGLIS
ncbi:MAG TPA: response regulator transcription factor [Bryobacteraceae bacterium]|jgi:DNA-binding NarL/FixJ family response regulator|nr:response regulator transcription factor [Bryobacteraceae bacterium]